MIGFTLLREEIFSVCSVYSVVGNYKGIFLGRATVGWRWDIFSVGVRWLGFKLLNGGGVGFRSLFLVGGFFLCALCIPWMEFIKEITF